MRLRIAFLFRATSMLLMLTACSGASPAPTPTLDPLAIKGRTVYKQNCATCHALEPDTVIIGPSLAGIATRAEARMPNVDAKGYLEISILKPEAYLVDGFTDVMPKDLGKKLTGEELDAVVAFLLTQK